MTRVLVTGGGGYIGSHACKRLAECGYEPVTFDNFSTGWRDAVRFGPMIEGDLLDPTSVAAAFENVRPEAVLHFAALSQVGESVAQPGRYWRNNVGGTLNLLEAMRDAAVSPLVFSSTAATYGEADLDLIPETASQSPTNPYGQTKLAIERMIADFGAAHGLRAVVFRYFNVAGADGAASIGERHRPETHLVPLILDAASGRRDSITVFGTDYPTPDGTCIRDYLHVEDLVDAHILGLSRVLDGGEGAVMNLGVGHGLSVREMIDRCRIVTGLDIPEILGSRRAGDPSRLVCDGRRARAEFDWNPTRSDPDRMIGDAWRW
ncbi:UDP-glucose 4-epimerase GalE, partial [Rubrimonas sp.]|uniref:UDP-glucose 4-epimerase GalE n=1 Tax=Rubrimonas sp. TaxID=2036015 RepID=UPI002FDE4060